MNITWNSLKSWDGKVSEMEFNKLIDVIQSITLNPGLNYTITRTAGGTTILPGGKGGGGSTPPPLNVTVGADPSDPTSLIVKISPGTVNQFLATNMFDTFPVDDTSTYYVKATISTDGQNVTSWELNVDTSTADTQNATASALPTSFDVLIAIIDSGKVYRVIGPGSIGVNGHEEFITDKDSPAGPGELPYIPYYSWEISTI